MFFIRRHIFIYFVISITLVLSACESLFGMPATPTSAIPSPTPPPLVATVNDEWIIEEEFLAELERYRNAQDALGSDVSAKDAAQTVLDDLIAQVLLAQAAHEGGFTLTEADLETRIDALESEVGELGTLANWLSNNGYSDSSFRISLKRATEAAWMRDKIISAVPKTADQVYAAQILFYNEEAARTVADQLNSGANFAELAILYEPNTGGQLGWFPRDYILEPALEEAAFGLEPDQYSDVITTEVGYHIIKVMERDSQHPLSPDAYLVLQAKALQDWLAQRRSESEIVLAP